MTFLLFFAIFSPLFAIAETHAVIENYFVPLFSSDREYVAHAHDYCYRLIRGKYIATHLTLVECENLLVLKRSELSSRAGLHDDDHIGQYNNIMKYSPPSPFTARTLSRYGFEWPEYILDIKGYYGDSFCNVVRDTNAGKVLDHVSRRGLPPDPAPRVLCVIITYEPRHHSAYAVASTWGAECTGFLAYSNSANYSIPTIAIDFNTSETMGNYWFKKIAVYQHIHQHYMQDFDWFLFGDDDTYVIVPNLYHFIQSDPIRWLSGGGRGVYAGRPMRLASFPGNHGELYERYNTFYNSGCGYLLDSVALQELVGELGVGCGQGLVDNNADVYVAQCLRARNIHPINTKDLNGADKFHHYHPEMIYTYNGDIHSEVGNFYFFNSYNFVAGLPGCSPDSIVFHYVKHHIYLQQIDAFFHMCK
jgi:hypothetical protein